HRRQPQRRAGEIRRRRGRRSGRGRPRGRRHRAPRRRALRSRGHRALGGDARRSRGGLRAHARLSEDAHAVRRADRLVPGAAAPHGDRLVRSGAGARGGARGAGGDRRAARRRAAPRLRRQGARRRRVHAVRGRGDPAPRRNRRHRRARRRPVLQARARGRGALRRRRVAARSLRAAQGLLMRFAFSDEQEALRREARRFLDEHSASAAVRRAMAGDRGFDDATWRALGELGWTSLAVPEAYGGAGLGWVELVAVLEEMGHALLCAPFFSTVCLGASALVLGGDEAQKREWLPSIAEGRTTATLAFAGGEVTARRDGGEVILDGEKQFVVDGHTAQLILVAAADGVYLVPADTRRLSRRAIATLDPTRKLAAVRLDGARVPSSARLPGDGAALLERVLDRAKIALAAEQLGGAARCLELSVDYAKTRVQFGRP